MIGVRPDVIRLPQGWPEELILPRGGQLIAAGDGAPFGLFINFLFLLMTVLAYPLQASAPRCTSFQRLACHWANAFSLMVGHDHQHHT